ncbi:hypothetical protein K435DRAFT_808970 [Dendrothele bispora CBS 962.96]|uniref:C2H2-type domain-containing protein n=1 Tax=Dendrothele bispora (strain CBS 962.96) TaxID=1314807 RepID=A0A4S8KZP4_DENBC|nr:hypothetical protein K435DRAFT_808970 [Dendrothele bispora CBS 962.96]
MSTPLGYDLQWETFISSFPATVIRSTLSTNDDFSINQFLSEPGPWDGADSTRATGTELKVQYKHRLLVENATGTMSAPAWGGITTSSKEELSGIPGSSSTTLGFSPPTSPDFSPAIPSSSTRFFTNLDSQALRTFTGSGNERGLSGGINQHHQIQDVSQLITSTIQDHSTNENECTAQGLRTDSAVNTPRPIIRLTQQVNASPGLFVCKSCGQEFTASHNLKYHIWSRLGIKPFRCQDPEFHKQTSVKWPQPDFSGYPDWVNDKHVSSLNDIVFKFGSHTSSNNRV